MAVNFTKNWNDEIAEITGQAEYQTCTITIIDPELMVGGVYNPSDNTYSPITEDGEVYSGQARFIPIRAGLQQGGESQANATTIRNVRFQLPQFDGPLYIRKGLNVQFSTAPRNPSLVGRWATVMDDFQGSSAATRTFTAVMDIDSGGPSA